MTDLEKTELDRQILERLRVEKALRQSGECCLADGMDDYVSKPVRAASLRKVLRKHLEGNHHKRPVT